MHTDIFITDHASTYVPPDRPLDSKRLKERDRDRKLRQSITIGRSRDDVYDFWRDLANLPRFMKDLVSVEIVSPTKSHWVMRLSNGTTAEWDAVIINDVPGESLSWKSVEGAKVATTGFVSFQQGPGASTVVRLSIDYAIPGGKLGEWAMIFTGEDPETLTATNLKRLKALLETGEVPTIEGQTSGREELQ